MFIDVFKNNGNDYIRLAESNRVLNDKGKKVARKTVILNIGPLEKFDDGQPGYLERLRKSFRVGEPLIPSLQPYCTNERPREKYTFTFEEGSPECVGTPKLYSHMLLERIIEELGLRNLFSSYKGFTKIKYDTRPFFLSNPEHIDAHLLICMIALIMTRIIQNRIVESGLVPSVEDKGLTWTAGLSAERIQTALNKWMVDKMPNDYYRFLNIDDPDLKLILDAFNISLPYKMYQRGELKSIKTGTKIFM